MLIEHQKLFRILGAPILFSPNIYLCGEVSVMHIGNMSIGIERKDYERKKIILRDER